MLTPVKLLCLNTSNSKFCYETSGNALTGRKDDIQDELGKLNCSVFYENTCQKKESNSFHQKCKILFSSSIHTLWMIWNDGYFLFNLKYITQACVWFSFHFSIPWVIIIRTFSWRQPQRDQVLLESVYILRVISQCQSETLEHQP